MLRVLQYNVQSCRAGVERVVDVIRRADPDVVAVNEVRRGQARRLGEALGMHVAFAATLTWRRFGNAVLSNERPARVRARRFAARAGREPRGMIAITLSEGVVVAAVHLGVPREEREAQARELVAVLEGARRLVVAGDLNERPDGPAVALLTQRLRDVFAGAPAGRSSTFPAAEPRLRIDYVLVSPGIEVIDAKVLPDIASDHLPMMAELAVES